MNPTKSPGTDNLTGKFLKEGEQELAKPITELINLSISLSSFPDDCKIAKLNPIYKKEDNTNPKSYKPISLLPLTSDGAVIIYDRDGGGRDMGQGLEENTVSEEGL